MMKSGFKAAFFVRETVKFYMPLSGLVCKINAVFKPFHDNKRKAWKKG